MSELRICMRLNNAFTHDRRVRREAEALVEAGHEVTVVADLKGNVPAGESVAGIRVHRIRKTSRIPYWSIIAPLRAEAADVYHAHDIDSLFPCLAASRLGSKRSLVVYDSHELWSGHARDKVHAKRRVLVRYEGTMLRHADALITASPAYTDEIVSRYRFGGTAMTLLNVPRYWTDEELAWDWGCRDAAGEIRIAAVSVFQHGRGAVQLIQSLAHLPANHVVELIGPIAQPDYEALMRAAAEPFGDRVRFAGAVPAAEVIPRLAQCHVSTVLIEPLSKSYRLTAPNKLFDSMAAGTPVVASDMRMIAQITRETNIGRICDVSDPADIARAVREVVADLPALQASARAAATRYNWDAERSKLVELYADLGKRLRNT
ncbi:MAG: glycosyltransferase [Actinomycetota bacterium]|nr:glycosyltransferase [Actinomycetota bacterium]